MQIQRNGSIVTHKVDKLRARFSAILIGLTPALRSLPFTSIRESSCKLGPIGTVPIRCRLQYVEREACPWHSVVLHCHCSASFTEAH